MRLLRPPNLFKLTIWFTNSAAVNEIARVAKKTRENRDLPQPPSTRSPKYAMEKGGNDTFEMGAYFEEKKTNTLLLKAKREGWCILNSVIIYKIIGK